MQFQVASDEGGGEFRVGGGTGAGTPDVRGDVMEFLTVLLVRNMSIRWPIVREKMDVRELTLSATMGPLVARVSAAITTPPSNRHPTMVVPVLVALGSGTPLAWRARFRLQSRSRM